MQQEANDQANLRLDYMKNGVAPPAKVVRGQKIDLTQVNSRGPNRVVMVNKKEDVEYWQPPPMPQEAFVENNYLMSDFDSLAGVFDAGSVTTNRMMNETVGGMKMLANSINPGAAFDLQLFVETWCEPVMWQVLKLEEMFEDDEMILMIAGNKANLVERFGISDITDEMLTRESTLTIKVGVGANNSPQERMGQFAQAWQIAQAALAPFVEAKVIAPPKPKVKEIISTVFGAAGFKDGGERFFDGLTDEQPPMPPPEAAPQDPAAMAKVQVDQQRLQADVEKMKAELALKEKELQQKSLEAEAKLMIEREKVQLEHQLKLAELELKQLDMRARAESENTRMVMDMHKTRAQMEHDAGKQQREHAYDATRRFDDYRHNNERDAAGFKAKERASSAKPAKGPKKVVNQAAADPGKEMTELSRAEIAERMKMQRERHAALMERLKRTEA